MTRGSILCELLCQIACVWRIVVDIEGDAFNTDEHNWVQGYGGHADINNPTSLYFVALYWATMTITTVGYGDVVRVTLWRSVLANLAGCRCSSCCCCGC